MGSISDLQIYITRSQHKVDISCESKTYDDMIMAYTTIHFLMSMNKSTPILFLFIIHYIYSSRY